MAKLSYARVKEIIQNGEGVIHDGAVYTRLEDLPPASKFVNTQEDKDTTLADLRAQAEEANRRLAELEAAQLPEPQPEVDPVDDKKSKK